MAARLFATYDKNFSYDLMRTAVAAEIVKNSVWTANELRYAVDVAALQGTSPPALGQSVPNVSGRNVTSTSGGRIGRPATPVQVTVAEILAGTLTEDQIAALAFATAPGDVTPDRDGPATPRSRSRS